MNNLKLPSGESLQTASEKNPLLFVFVRHKGCTFCREALSELKIHQNKLLHKKLKVFVVHMGPQSTSEEFAKDYELTNVEFISDPNKVYYKSFGLRRGTLKELFGPRVWLRGFQAGVLNGHGLGALEGDGFQMGGVFILFQGKVKQLHDPCDAADIGSWSRIDKDIDEFLGFKKEVLL